jgi:bla regulator protein blaR1
VYALIVVKKGPPLSADQSPPAEAGPPDPNGPMPRGAMRMTAGSASGRAVPMPLLARFLGQMLGRPVIDKTGLTGRYDIDARWTPESVPPELPPGAPVPEADGPSLFTALQEQVGLKLESTTGPVDQMVIESVERPIAN